MATKTIETYENGVLVDTKTVDVAQSEVNTDAVYAKSVQALDVNSTFLALSNPTGAQNAAQAKALTRQMNGLIRLLLGQLDDVSDT